MSSSYIATLFVIIPLSTAFLVSLLSRFSKQNLISALSVFSCGLLLFISSVAFNAVNSAVNNTLVYNIGGWAAPFGICLVLDGLSAFMLVIINLIAFFASVYNLGYMRGKEDIGKFNTLFFMLLAGMNGVAVTGDLFNLFVFLEVASIASYALVSFNDGAEELEASFKYAIMGSVGSCFIFIGIAFLYSFTSTLNMADMSRVLASKSGLFVVPFVSVLFLMGFGVKSALAPFHSWLPDAHSSSPASISAMLSGVLIKTLGIYSIARIFFNVFTVGHDFLSVFMILGVVSMVVSAFLALPQWNMKRLFAYSSIGQIGYIALGLGLATPLGIIGAILHIFQHSVGKSLLFLTAGSVDRAAGTRDLREMSGLKEKMPVTAAASMVASMSISGVPPFGGFFSKLIILVACVQKGYYFYAFLAVISSILTLAALAKVQRFAFFGELKEKLKNIKESPASMCFSMIGLSVICLLGGLLLLPYFRPFVVNAASVLVSGEKYSGFVLGAALK